MCLVFKHSMNSEGLGEFLLRLFALFSFVQLSFNFFQGVLLNMHAYSIAQLCPALCDPMDCSPPGSSVYGILQVRILQCVANSSMASSQHRDGSGISCIAGGFFTAEPSGKSLDLISLYIIKNCSNLSW